jgi:hypothetical protein
MELQAGDRALKCFVEKEWIDGREKRAIGK